VSTMNPSSRQRREATAADTTADRLIDAAEMLFSEQGFAGTSVRDITSAAGCNVASVHYHFGGKSGLYETVFARRLTMLRDVRIEAVKKVVDEAVAKGRVEPVLHAFAHAFLAPFIDLDRGPRTARLLMREILDPHLPAGMILQRMIMPIHETMVDALTRVCPSLTPVTASLCLHSLVGQLVHLIHAWKIFGDAERVEGPLFDLDRAIDHVVKFSSAGVRSYVDAGEGGTP